MFAISQAWTVDYWQTYNKPFDLYEHSLIYIYQWCRVRTKQTNTYTTASRSALLYQQRTVLPTNAHIFDCRRMPSRMPLVLSVLKP